MTIDTDKSGVTLLPCPFCGGENVKTFGPYGWYRNWGISHSCRAFYSGAQELAQGFLSEAEAIAAWNTRANQAPADASVVEALEAQMEAQADDLLPSSLHREQGRVWLEGWFDIPAALATLPATPEPTEEGGLVEPLLDDYDRERDEQFRLAGHHTGHGVGKVAPHRDQHAQAQRVADARDRILTALQPTGQVEAMREAAVKALRGLEPPRRRWINREQAIAAVSDALDGDGQ